MMSPGVTRCSRPGSGPRWHGYFGWWLGAGQACLGLRSISARRIDRHQLVEIEFDDRLQHLAGAAVAQSLRESVEPGGIFGLQGDELADGIAPALSPAAAVGGAPVVDHRPGWGAGSAMP